MGLFGNNHIKSVATGNTNAFSNLVSGLQRMWTRAPSRDRMQLPDLAHKSPRLDPIFIIGRAVAGTEWNLYNKLDLKKNGKTAEPVINTDIIDLFDYPIRRYPEIDWYALCYSTVCVVKAVGEYAWLKVRDEKGKVFEIDPIPPGWIMRTPTAGDPYYTIYPFGVTAGKALIVSPDDIVYFKKSDLNDPFSRGRGDSEQLEDEFEVDEYASKSQKNLFFNDATPPYIITAPGMPKSEADGFKQSWMQKLGGYGHKREPGVIGFDAKVLQLGMSPQEMDFVESRKFIREEVYQHYQIPPEIYGNIQNSNRATITSAEYLFHKNVLNTEYRFFERVITRQLIAMDFDKDLCFKFEDIVPDDEDFKLQVYNAGVTNGTITKNEWRKAFDLPPLKASVGDVLQTTFSTYTIPIDGTEPSEPVKPENTTGQTEDKPTDDDMIDAGAMDEAGKAIFDLLQKQKQASVEKKKTIKIVSKYNPNHDALGRFSSSNSSNGNIQSKIHPSSSEIESNPERYPKLELTETQKAEIDKTIELAEKNPVGIWVKDTPDMWNNFLSGEDYENQFVTNKTGAIDDQKKRTSWESTVLRSSESSGTDLKVDGEIISSEDRPKYGATYRIGQEGGAEAGSSYGSIIMVMNDTVKNRSTYTNGDSSLGAPSFSLKSKETAYCGNKNTGTSNDYSMGKFKTSVSGMAETVNMGIMYQETQIWGKVTPSKDVKEIHILDGNRPNKSLESIKKFSQKYNIPIKIVKADGSAVPLED